MTFNWLTNLQRRLQSQPRSRRRSRPVTSAICRVERLEQRQLLSAAAVGDEQQVNTTTTGNQQTNTTGQGGSMAMDSTGNYVVVWTSAGQDGSGNGVYAQMFSASGIAIGAEFQVNTTTAND